MKRVIDLTMHIYEGMGIGRVFPEEQEFLIEDVFTYEQHGLRLERAGVNTYRHQRDIPGDPADKQGRSYHSARRTECENGTNRS